MKKKILKIVLAAAIVFIAYNIILLNQSFGGAYESY